MLWCDRQPQDTEDTEGAQKRKREESNYETGSSTGHGTNRLENEQNVEETYKKVLEKHADVWVTLHLQLWARMICSGCHDDYDIALCIPAFTSTALKKPRKGESLSEALTRAAVAFAKAISGSAPEKAVAQGMHQESQQVLLAPAML